MESPEHAQTGCHSAETGPSEVIVLTGVPSWSWGSQTRLTVRVASMVLRLCLPLMSEQVPAKITLHNAVRIIMPSTVVCKPHTDL